MTVRRLIPGVYDANGELHVDLVEFCLGVGWEPTDENQDLAAQVISDAVRELPGGESVEVELQIDTPLPWQGHG